MGRRQQKQQNKKQSKQSEEQVESKRQERRDKRVRRQQRAKFDELQYELDMQKFKKQLIRFGLQVKETKADGNCLFRALSDQLRGTEDFHAEFRANCAEYIEENKELYKFFMEDDETIEDYINWIRQPAKWGSQLEMNALAQIYSFNVVIHKVDGPGMAQEFFPWGSVPTLHISYHLGEHYNSVRSAQDPLTGPATDFPVSHILQEVYVPDDVLEEEKKHD